MRWLLFWSASRTPDRRACRRCVVPLAALATACASGGGATSPAGPGVTSTTIGVRTGAGVTGVETTNEAAVSEGTVPASVAAVWAALPGIFEQLDIEPTHIERAAALMGNPGYRPRRIEGQRLSRFLDCGRGLTRPYADTYEVRMAVSVQLFAAAGGGTVLRTALDAYAEDRGSSAAPVHCQSTGNLERRIWELAEEATAR